MIPFYIGGYWTIPILWSIKLIIVKVEQTVGHDSKFSDTSGGVRFLGSFDIHFPER